MPAQIIYSAKIIKESAQPPELTGNEIAHPFDDTKGDLLYYYNDLPAMNAYHARCLSIKATCAVNLGLNVTGGNETATLDRTVRVNEDGESLLQVLHRVAIDYETTGNGFLECVRGKGGRVEELYFCPAMYTYRRPRGSSSPFFYRAPHGGMVEYQRFDPESNDPHSLIHFSQATQSSRYYGLPEWRGVVPDIELDYYATLYSQKFFINSGVPDLVILVEGGQFDQETEEKVVEFVRQNFKGVDNAHRTLYLPVNDSEVKVRFERLAPDNAWSAPIEKIRESCRDRILSGHGVPPRLAGVVTSGQLGGGGEAEGQLGIFQGTTIAPRQRMFAEQINRLLPAMGIKATIAFETLNTSASEKESEKYERLVNAGIITVDEARFELGWNQDNLADRDDGDGEDDAEAVAKRHDLLLLRKLEAVREAL